MGITTFTVGKLEKCILEHKPKNVGEYGSQNLYLDGQPLPAPYANIFYEKYGIEYTCFDLSEENNCLVYDLTYLLPEEFTEKFDLVTDIGCSEHYGRNGEHHIEGFYNSWLNKHRILKVGGKMYNENPKTGNWAGHGFQYYTQEFYHQLTEISGYEIIEIGEHAACNNYIDGLNIWCILKKMSNKFPTLEEFKKLDLKRK